MSVYGLILAILVILVLLVAIIFYALFEIIVFNLKKKLNLLTQQQPSDLQYPRSFEGGDAPQGPTTYNDPKDMPGDGPSTPPSFWGEDPDQWSDQPSKFSSQPTQWQTPYDQPRRQMSSTFRPPGNPFAPPPGQAREWKVDDIHESPGRFEDPTEDDEDGGSFELDETQEEPTSPPLPFQPDHPGPRDAGTGFSPYQAQKEVMPLPEAVEYKSHAQENLVLNGQKPVRFDRPMDREHDSDKPGADQVPPPSPFPRGPPQYPPQAPIPPPSEPMRIPDRKDESSPRSGDRKDEEGWSLNNRKTQETRDAEEKTETRDAEEKQEIRETEEKPEIGETEEKPEIGNTEKNRGRGETEEKTETRETEEIPEIRETEEKTETREYREKPGERGD